jgi:hypothetical protein
MARVLGSGRAKCNARRKPRCPRMVRLCPELLTEWCTAAVRRSVPEADVPLSMYPLRADRCSYTFADLAVGLVDRLDTARSASAVGGTSADEDWQQVWQCRQGAGPKGVIALAEGSRHAPNREGQEPQEDAAAGKDRGNGRLASRRAFSLAAITQHTSSWAIRVGRKRS